MCSLYVIIISNMLQNFHRTPDHRMPLMGFEPMHLDHGPNVISIRPQATVTVFASFVVIIVYSTFTKCLKTVGIEPPSCQSGI